LITGRRTRLARTALLAGATALSLSTAACGGRDGSASTTTPAPATPPLSPTTRPRPVERFKGISDPTYSRGENWLCGPRAASDDRCADANQDTTIVRADGRTEVRASDPPHDPPVDCFYVYPPFGWTGDIDTAMNRDTTTEETLIFEQAARLREQCRVYAPLFKQAGLGSNQSVPYTDIHAAFRHYMGQWNGGRRVILFGQAQGAEHLTRLLQDEFDDDPEMRALLVSAFLIGGRVDVPAGARVGGTFKNIPACGAPTETSCVVGWSLASSTTPREIAAKWGDAPSGRARLCVNPANPAGGAGSLTPIVIADGQRNTPTEIGTPFVELPDLLTAECQTSGSITSLVVRAASPDDMRNPGPMLTNAPQWGLFLSGVSLAMGSIMQLLAQQVAQKP
jgi:hypothetical protein